jgi:hypothetical protein
MQVELCGEKSERDPIPALAFDAEYDDGLWDDVEEDIVLDEESRTMPNRLSGKPKPIARVPPSPAADRTCCGCSSTHARRGQ